MKMPFLDGEPLFLDCQTTGASPPAGELIQIAWQKNLMAPRAFYIYLGDEFTVSRPIELLTGITSEKLRTEGTPRHEVLKNLMLDLDGKPPCHLIIHYARFEKPFLQKLFNDFKIGEFSKIKIYCTHQIAKRLYPGLPAKGIRGLAGFFGAPLTDLKEAPGHVVATCVIWDGLRQCLIERGVDSFEKLDHFLKSEFSNKREKYRYPLDSAKRLSLPKGPGIYRMLGKNKNILYIGKATSLHGRVNSYFRGQKGRDGKKLEMLTQVWDISVKECRTPLEAALYENEEIKKYDPPYNICLKLGERRLFFYSRDLLEFSHRQESKYPIGPFSHDAFEQVRLLAQSLREKIFDPHIFFDPLDPKILNDGFTLFCETESLKLSDFCSLRLILAQGLRQYRKDKLHQSVQEDLDEEPKSNTEVTVTEVAAKFQRLLSRAGSSYLKTKRLTKLLNSEIFFEQVTLKFRQGSLLPEESQETVLDEASKDLLKHSWRELDVVTYDRMAILLSEISRFSRLKQKVYVKYNLPQVEISL